MMQPEKRKKLLFRFVVLFLVILVGSIFVKLYTWLFPEPDIPLLAQAPGLHQYKTIEQAIGSPYNPVFLEPYTLPNTDLFVVGVYTEASGSWKPGSLVRVYTRFGWRALEWVQKPQQTLDDELKLYGDKQKEDVMFDLGGIQIKGVMVTVNTHPKCHTSSRADLPSICQISHSLLVPIGEDLMILSADADHATVGELIALARTVLLLKNGK